MSALPSSKAHEPAVRPAWSSDELHRHAIALRNEAIDQLWRDLGSRAAAGFAQLMSRRATGAKRASGLRAGSQHCG